MTSTDIEVAGSAVDADRAAGRVFVPGSKDRHDGWELWPDPCGEMPVDPPEIDEQLKWTPDKWRAYVLRHTGLVWKDIYAELHREKGTVASGSGA